MSVVRPKYLDFINIAVEIGGLLPPYSCKFVLWDSILGYMVEVK